MAQAVAEAEQEVYEGAGPIRASIGPKNGSENSYSSCLVPCRTSGSIRV